MRQHRSQVATKKCGTYIPIPSDFHNPNTQSNMTISFRQSSLLNLLYALKLFGKYLGDIFGPPGVDRIPCAQAKNTKIVTLIARSIKIKTNKLHHNYGPTNAIKSIKNPSLEPLDGKEASTRRKIKFINAFAHNTNSKSLATISRDCKIGPSPGRK